VEQGCAITMLDRIGLEESVHSNQVVGGGVKHVDIIKAVQHILIINNLRPLTSQKKQKSREIFVHHQINTKSLISWLELSRSPKLVVNSKRSKNFSLEQKIQFLISTPDFN